MTPNYDRIPEIALTWHRQGKGAALATVIETWGSAPRPVGSQLVISGEGDMEGSVSGGCVEGAVVIEAIDCLEGGTATVLEFGVADEQAFAVGLAGIFVNLKGKYSQGIVNPGDEADRLREEIAGRLAELVDPESGAGAVKRVYHAARVYSGPYKDAAPDLIVGYERGYRASWETVIGQTTDCVFHSNTKAWSGDHCIDPSLVPGVLFCNRPVETESPRLMDIGPTVLDLFGAAIPRYMDGKPLEVLDKANGDPDHPKEKRRGGG